MRLEVDGIIDEVDLKILSKVLELGSCERARDVCNAVFQSPNLFEESKPGGRRAARSVKTIQRRIRSLVALQLLRRGQEKGIVLTAEGRDFIVYLVPEFGHDHQQPKDVWIWWRHEGKRRAFRLKEGDSLAIASGGARGG